MTCPYFQRRCTACEEPTIHTCQKYQNLQRTALQEALTKAREWAKSDGGLNPEDLRFIAELYGIPLTGLRRGIGNKNLLNLL